MAIVVAVVTTHTATISKCDRRKRHHRNQSNFFHDLPLEVELKCPDQEEF
jgi:hypothetical protein